MQAALRAIVGEVRELARARKGARTQARAAAESAAGAAAGATPRATAPARDAKAKYAEEMGIGGC